MRYLPYLSDEVVIVRPWKVDDARAVVAGYREPEISYWSGMPSPFTFGYALAWIGDAEAAWADGNDAHLAIVDAASGRVVGAIGLLGVDPLESLGRFRYWVRTARRGHGFARHALALVAAWARDDLGLERLEVATAVADAGAQQVARAVGFRPEAIYRSYRQLGEHRTDYYIYALPMPSWHVGPDFVDGIEQAEVAAEHERPASHDVVLPPAPPILAGSGLRLRPYRDDDLAALVASIDEETARWLNHIPWPYSEDEGRWFLNFVTTSWLAHQAQFAIADAASDALLGGVNVDIDLVNAIGEVGYRVNPSARGKHVATRAVELVAAWAFDELGLARLDLGIDTRNSASLQVAAGSGFRREGTLHGLVRRGDERSDDAVLSLLPSDRRPA
ncbi:MAG: GNAT family N-acetyltransferase [Thermoleophilia bacterium]